MSQPGTALITGASTGIGAVYAEQLARRGHDLILVARSQARLNSLATRLAEQTGRRIEVLPADLAARTDLARVEQRLREDPSITLLVNNAGIGTHTPLLDSDVEQMQQMITLNITALTRLTYAAVPGFVARGHGAVINISSIVSLQPELLNGVYGASKAFVTAFSQSLQHELGDKGVRIQAVLPGATATDFWATGGLPIEHLDPGIVMSAQDLVRAALQDFDAGRRVSIPPLHELERYEALEASRQALAGHLSNQRLAPRYNTGVASGTSLSRGKPAIGPPQPPPAYSTTTASPIA
ncbi:SDR family oxidoreductase [Pseudomonas entomophila]|uniref:SDR family NAD(P)-dependent oxidoreductase n=1 Tax=Pseudomonas entomophila TaxID=312306 RepID=UPI0023D7D61E|nr:SDR family oxidoreductase [Pseudomonas entomophila]MDF0732118.1 SDR family oxidoreductase [Pseudomonas entomophila]